MALKKESFKEFFKTEEDLKIFNQVFDKSTLNTLHELSSKGWFKTLEHIISTGKEAHVYKAVDKSGNPRAVKIYKILTSNFNNMQRYLEGDIRFDNIKKDKRSIVFAWAKKEFKNLERAVKSSASVPVPLAFKKNVMVMTFIGDEEAAPLLKDVKELDAESVHNQIVENISKLFYKANLIHSDLSEYNMLYWNEKIYFIDIGQGILRSHPKAREFFERDLHNTAKFLRRIGYETDFDSLYAEIKQKSSDF
ncbi:MAG TPA: serine protein kinase RIO [archaeon]|nr:serine protein kinase RIO [archaeon]